MSTRKIFIAKSVMLTNRKEDSFKINYFHLCIMWLLECTLYVMVVRLTFTSSSVKYSKKYSPDACKMVLIQLKNELAPIVTFVSVIIANKKECFSDIIVMHGFAPCLGLMANSLAEFRYNT